MSKILAGKSKISISLWCLLFLCFHRERSALLGRGLVWVCTCEWVSLSTYVRLEMKISFVLYILLFLKHASMFRWSSWLWRVLNTHEVSSSILLWNTLCNLFFFFFFMSIHKKKIRQKKSPPYKKNLHPTKKISTYTHTSHQKSLPRGTVRTLGLAASAPVLRPPTVVDVPFFALGSCLVACGRRWAYPPAVRDSVSKRAKGLAWL